MANVQLYARMLVTVDGKLLTEETGVTVSQNSGGQVQNTVAKGFAGLSPGAGNVEIDVENAIPAAGFEVDLQSKMFNNETVELGVTMSSGDTLTVTGFILSLNAKHAVNGEATVGFKFVGGIAVFE